MVDKLNKVRKPSAYQGDKRKVSSSIESYSPFFLLHFIAINYFLCLLELLRISIKKTYFYFLILFTIIKQQSQRLLSWYFLNVSNMIKKSFDLMVDCTTYSEWLGLVDTLRTHYNTKILKINSFIYN